MCAASDSTAGLSLEKMAIFLLTLSLIMMKTTYCHFTKQLFLSTRTRIIHAANLSYIYIKKINLVTAEQKITVADNT